MSNSEDQGEEVTLPWQESSPMSERKRFVDLHLRGEHSSAELCRRFGVGRKTGYKWLRRFFDGCEPCLRKVGMAGPATGGASSGFVPFNRSRI